MNTKNVEQQHNAYVTTSNPLWSREKSSGKTFQHALSCSRQPSLCTQTRCFPGIITRPRCLWCTSSPLVSPSSPSLSTDFVPLPRFDCTIYICLRPRGIIYDISHDEVGQPVHTLVMRSAGSRTPLEASRHRTLQNIGISRFRDLFKIPWSLAKLFLPRTCTSPYGAVFYCHPYWCLTLTCQFFPRQTSFLTLSVRFKGYHMVRSNTYGHLHLYECSRHCNVVVAEGCMYAIRVQSQSYLQLAFDHLSAKQRRF